MNDLDNWGDPDNWTHWFYGDERLSCSKFEEKERMYAAFLGRMIAEGYIQSQKEKT